MVALSKIGDYVMDIVGDYPVITGVVAPFLSIGVSFVDGLEIGLRLGILTLGLIAAGLTVMAKVKQIKKLNTRDRASGDN